MLPVLRGPLRASTVMFGFVLIALGAQAQTSLDVQLRGFEYRSRYPGDSQAKAIQSFAEACGQLSESAQWNPTAVSSVDCGNMVSVAKQADRWQYGAQARVTLQAGVSVQILSGGRLDSGKFLADDFTAGGQKWRDSRDAAVAAYKQACQSFIDEARNRHGNALVLADCGPHAESGASDGWQYSSEARVIVAGANVPTEPTPGPRPRPTPVNPPPAACDARAVQAQVDQCQSEKRDLISRVIPQLRVQYSSIQQETLDLERVESDRRMCQTHRDQLQQEGERIRADLQSTQQQLEAARQNAQALEAQYQEALNPVIWWRATATLRRGAVLVGEGRTRTKAIHNALKQCFDDACGRGYGGPSFRLELTPVQRAH